jgi:hypothetical protein
MGELEDMFRGRSCLCPEPDGDVVLFKLWLSSSDPARNVNKPFRGSEANWLRRPRKGIRVERQLEDRRVCGDGSQVVVSTYVGRSVVN